MDDNDVSTSGFVVDDEEISAKNTFGDVKDIATKGYSRLLSASRYGKTHILKGLKPEFRNERFYENLLRKEFEISVILDHNNIVRVYDFVYIPDVGNCMVMEYVDGMTMKQFFETKRPKYVYDKILNELLDAMSYFHSKQIIHRDLKPENILITNNGNNVKIIDFGLSDTDDYIVLKQAAGTRKYAAPEQIASSGIIDCRADIYSLGIIMKNSFPNSYRKIAEKCSQYEKEKRFSSVDEIRKTLRNNRIKNAVALSSFALLIVFALFFTISNYFFSNNSYSIDEKRFLSESTQYIDSQIETINDYIGRGVVSDLDDYNEVVGVWHGLATSDIDRWKEGIPKDDPFYVDFEMYWNIYLGESIRETIPSYTEWKVASFNLILNNLKPGEQIMTDPENPLLIMIVSSESE